MTKVTVMIVDRFTDNVLVSEETQINSYDDLFSFIDKDFHKRNGHYLSKNTTYKLEINEEFNLMRGVVVD